MLRKILAGIAIILVILAAVIAMQPSEFKISRSITIEASASDVFQEVIDFHRWPNWSPWARLDPAMKTEFTGTPGVDGSSHGWSGNSAVGEGRMTLIKSIAPSLILIKLDFTRPMKATNITQFSFESQGAATAVTWTMSGNNNFIAKAFHLVMSMDKMVGPDFEHGLAKLKDIAEKKTPAAQ